MVDSDDTVAPDLLEKLLAGAERSGAELVLCVGGGSVIDSGKAIALGLKNPQYDLWSTFTNMTPLTNAAPVASILTFPAAGSESSKSPGSMETAPYAASAA